MSARSKAKLLPALLAIPVALAACGGSTPSRSSSSSSTTATTAAGGSASSTSTSAAGGSGGSAASGSTIKIGEIASLTGNYTPLGTNDRYGAELAVSEVNAAGGVDGHKLQLIVKDDATEPNQAVTDYNDLVASGVVAVAGSSFSNSSLAVIPIVSRKKIPYVSTAASDQQVNPVNPYVFMTPPTAGVVATTLLQYFKAQGMTKMAMAYDTKSAFALTGEKKMKAEASKYGIDFVDVETFETTTTNFSSVLTHVRSSGAKGLMVWATGSPAVVITKQFAQASMNMPLVMSHAEASTLYTKPSGSAANGVIVASSLGVIGPYLPAGQLKSTVLAMAKPFQAKHGYYPPQFALDGYNAVKLIVAAMKKDGTTPADIAKGLSNLTLLTPEGTYHYTPTDHSGLGTQDVAIDVVKNGNFVPTPWTTKQLKSGAS